MSERSRGCKGGETADDFFENFLRLGSTLRSPGEASQKGKVLS